MFNHWTKIVITISIINITLLTYLTSLKLFKSFRIYYNRVKLGDDYGSWVINTKCITNKKNKNNKNNELIYYGVGCGENIDFDIELLIKYNFNIYLFDPTPRSIKYVKPILNKLKENKKYKNKIKFTPEGLGINKKNEIFLQQKNEEHVSLIKDTDGINKENYKVNKTDKIILKLNTLQNWMNKYNHTYIDILKIDIESSEYEVLLYLFSINFTPFKQILIEYHQRFLTQDKLIYHSLLKKTLKNNGFIQFYHSDLDEYGYVNITHYKNC